MRHILVRRRVDMVPGNPFQPEPVPLPHLPHICILLVIPLLPGIRVVIVIESEYGEADADREAGAQDAQEDDEWGSHCVAHVVSFRQGHGISLMDVHFGSVKSSSLKSRCR